MSNKNRGIIAVAGFTVMLMIGLTYAWSVFSKSIGAANPEWTKTELSVTVTIIMVSFCVGSLAAGILSKWVKAKVFMVFAAILFLAGFFIASKTDGSPLPLYLGLGACGAGSGMAYNATMGTVCAWFPDMQGTISGILLMGFGFSSFIIGKIFAAVTPSDGSTTWCHTFFVLGVIVCIVLLVCAFFMNKPGADFKPSVPRKQKTVREPASDIGTAVMIKQPSFWMMYLWTIFISAAGLVLIGQSAGMVVQVSPNVADGTIATVAGLISIMNGLGRVVMGMMYDKFGYRITMIFDMICFVIAGVILLAAIIMGNFGILVAGFVIGGFAYSAVTPMQSAVISDFFGRTHYSSNLSIVITNLLIASFASTIAGKLYDITQSYFTACVMMLVCTIVAFIVSIGVKRPEAK